jgi:hypothetical protein
MISSKIYYPHNGRNKPTIRFQRFASLEQMTFTV